MQSVSYWDAWSFWWSGQKVDEMQMWGLSLLWWGRIGKLLQFIGGLIVIFDLIGSVKLNNAAEKVSRRAQRMRHSASRHFEGHDETHNERRQSRIDKIDRFLVNVLTIAILSIMAWIAVRHFNLIEILFRPSDERHPLDYLLKIPAIIALIIAFLGAMSLSRVLISAAHLPLLALAWLFDSNRPGHPARWIAFFVVVVGFHLDLLAS